MGQPELLTWTERKVGHVSPVTHIGDVLLRNILESYTLAISINFLGHETPVNQWSPNWGAHENPMGQRKNILELLSIFCLLRVMSP